MIIPRNADGTADWTEIGLRVLFAAFVACLGLALRAFLYS